MFQKISDSEFRLHGELPLHDVEGLLGIQLVAEDVTTVGGYLVEELGHFPQTGERLTVNGYEFTVLRTTGHQIFQVTAKRLQTSESTVDVPA